MNGRYAKNYFNISLLTGMGYEMGKMTVRSSGVSGIYISLLRLDAYFFHILRTFRVELFQIFFVSECEFRVSF